MADGGGDMANPDVWPELRLADWKDTCDTLHMWTQIVGKIRMELSPHRNHWWSTTLYVTPRGLSTSTMYFGDRAFDVEFDFLASLLRIRFSDGTDRSLGLVPRTVADFHRELFSVLAAEGVNIRISSMPQEFPDPIPFDQDTTHASYDADNARRFHRVLLNTDRLLKEYQSDWLGKASPTHFFWGSFDLCVTRFSGKRAPEREGADCVTKEAYSHECISAGFWPGGGPADDAAFYAYTAPAPAGYGAKVGSEAAYFNKDWNEYLLSYEDVRKSADPDHAVREFLQSTYEIGANLAGWDREALEQNRKSKIENPKSKVGSRPCAGT